MGLPGSGKTTLADQLAKELYDAGKAVTRLNADAVRKTGNDWDFSPEGRIRQAYRMMTMADIAETDYVIADFIAPLVKMRTIFNADYTVWIDTIKVGRFDDTNKAFIPPETYDIRVVTQDCVPWATIICNHLLAKSNV